MMNQKNNHKQEELNHKANELFYSLTDDEKEETIRFMYELMENRE